MEDVSFRHRRAANQKAAAPKASGGGKAKSAAKVSKTGGNSAAAVKAQKAGGSAPKSVGGVAKSNAGGQIQAKPNAGVIGKMQKAAPVTPKPPNCAGVNIENLMKCCRAPVSDFFPTSMLVACNKQRNNGGLFKNI
ncbi:hypothetical protein B566_EDAN010590, partial [Ephemera danica]